MSKGKKARHQEKLDERSKLHFNLAFGIGRRGTNRRMRRHGGNKL